MRPAGVLAGGPGAAAVESAPHAASDACVRLRRRIADRTARVAIVGLGYVGLPTAVAYAQAGFTVAGVDVDLDRCATVNAGGSHTGDVPAEAVAAEVAASRLRAVGSLADADDPDVIDICVPTPLDKSREPDLSAIVAVIDGIRERVRPGQLVVLTSTTYPGTTVELLQPALEGAGLITGHDVFIAFAPERIDPGNPTHGLRSTPRVVGGVTPGCTALAVELFSTICDTVVPVSSPTAAEMTKLLENTFRSINIALANEVAVMCRHLGLDVWEVIGAAATKPYGFMPFYPGPGLGGHCIPVDPSYLAWKLRRLNQPARFIDLANEVNRSMPRYVVQRVTDVLNEEGRSVKGSRILLLGVSYKRDVGDMRESPALDILAMLNARGARLSYADPHVPAVTLDGVGEMRALQPTPEVLAVQDLVVITTDHGAFDWDAVRHHARIVLDTRGGGRGLHHPAWHTL